MAALDPILRLPGKPFPAGELTGSWWYPATLWPARSVEFLHLDLREHAGHECDMHRSVRHHLHEDTPGIGVRQAGAVGAGQCDGGGVGRAEID